MRLLLLSFIALILISADHSREAIRKGKDYALFFAVDNYDSDTRFDNLKNPVKDANAIASILKDSYNFETKVYKNPSKDSIYTTLHQWQNQVFEEDAQLFIFFSGHGTFDEFEKKGYFIPYGHEDIDLTTLGNIVTQIPCKHILLAIDACYSGTIDQRIAFRGEPDFKRPNATADTEQQNLIHKKLRYQSRLLLTSGEKNRTPDGKEHSPFSGAIIKKLRFAYTYGDGLVTFTDLLSGLERISPTPYQGTLQGHNQGGFVFVSNEIQSSQENIANDDPNFKTSQDNEPEGTSSWHLDFQSYPDNSTQPTKNPSENASLPDLPNHHQMKLVPSGTFTMGCTSEQNNCGQDEKQLRKVTLDAYWIDQHEVTNAQYAHFLNEYGSDEVKQGAYIGQKMIYEYKWGITKVDGKWQAQKGYENHPVVYVTWYGANEYAQYYDLRLPTEAEWEYAARGATTQNQRLYAGSSNIEDVAWYNGNAGRTTHQVMSKQANALGLYDMSGNVREWCADWKGMYAEKEEKNPKGVTTGTARVLRGGSWSLIPPLCRVSKRSLNDPNSRSLNDGFRCVKEL